VLACVKDGKLVESVGEGEEAQLILDHTPFYAEKGGQVGDQGLLENENTCFMVYDTQNPFSGLITHEGKVKFGEIRTGATLFATIDHSRREKIEMNHTATHLLHLALHEVLGEHARQKGSFVNDTYLRLDFAHHKAVSREELYTIERRVNELIRQNHEVVDFELVLEEAQKRADIKQFFGEKYGEMVRVLEVGPSRELCGGCHVIQTGKIGYFRILREMSIAAGIRRIEAVTGERAVEEGRVPNMLLEELAAEMKTPVSKLQERVTQLVASQKASELELKAMKRDQVRLIAAQLPVSLSPSQKKIVSGIVELEPAELKGLSEEIFRLHPHAIVIVGCCDQGRAHLYVRRPASEASVHAGELLRRGLALINGNGGGRAEIAQGSGKESASLEKAVQHMVASVE